MTFHLPAEETWVLSPSSDHPCPSNKDPATASSLQFFGKELKVFVSWPPFQNLSHG